MTLNWHKGHDATPPELSINHTHGEGKIDILENYSDIFCQAYDYCQPAKGCQSLTYRRVQDFENRRRTGNYSIVTCCDTAGWETVGANSVSLLW